MNEPMAPVPAVVTSSTPRLRALKLVLSATAFVVCTLIAILSFSLLSNSSPKCVWVESFTQADCFRYTHLNESEQPTLGCARRLIGSCSSAPGVCTVFAFVSDINTSVVAAGYTGEMYQCTDSCPRIGEPCECFNPAIGRATSFCLRTVDDGFANFACH